MTRRASNPGTSLWWALAAVAVACVPVVSGLWPTRVFCTRDLSFFWPRYLWLRRTLWAGVSPLWDPYGGGGQSAIHDALHQFFLLPSLVVRFLGPESLGFNLWVAMPLPLAALGGYLWLRRRYSPAAAAFGAVAYAVSGPVVSTVNMPNLSWSVAGIPWLLWAVDRYVGRRTWRDLALLALVQSQLALAGEPVTLVAASALALAHAVLLGSSGASETGGRVNGRTALFVAAGLVVGALAASVQLLPMVAAAQDSLRGMDNFNGEPWALHPFGLIETVSQSLFGNGLTPSPTGDLPWMRALNSGREPFFFSIYLGPMLLALATLGLVAGRFRGWSLFWLVTGILGVMLASGNHTPLLDALKAVFPPLKTFRYPAKYFVFSMVAVSALATDAAERLLKSDVQTAADAWWRRARTSALGVSVAIGAMAYAAAAGAQYLKQPMGAVYHALATFVGADPVPATYYMLIVGAGAANRLLVMSCAAGFLLWLAASGRRGSRLLAAACLMSVAADLAVSAWPVNPTAPARVYADPSWPAALAPYPHDRYYLGGKDAGSYNLSDLDAATAFRAPIDLDFVGQNASLMGQAAWFPGAYRIREVFSEDLAVLWPSRFVATHIRFGKGTRQERDNFLDRAGVRFRILPLAQAPGRKPLARWGAFDDGALFDWGPQYSRVMMASRAQVAADYHQQVDLMRSGVPASPDAVIVSRVTALAGTPGPAEPPSATFTRDDPQAIDVDARAGADGGFVVLFDSFSKDWTAAVDGVPAEIAEANGLYRAVHVAPGRHRVEFRYHPPAALFAGAGLTVFCLLLMGGAAVRRPEPPSTERRQRP